VCGTVVADAAGPLEACRAHNGWTYRAVNAYVDAQTGRLSRSPIAACQANGALARRLHFRGRHAEATFDVAIGATRSEAAALLRAARSGDPAAQQAATEAWWASWLAPARLPATDDPLVTAFARRSLIVMRTATDSASGAIVASVDTQGPYGEDWVRDGAFIDHALDVAGYHDLVTRNEEFYARVQRTQPSGWSLLYSFPSCDPAHPVYPNCIPAGTFETNYYADPAAVVPGNPISFEIDEAGLGVWTLWDHYQYLDDPAARAAYLAAACPAIRLGAVNLAACRDPTTGLQCPANEDDNIPLTQGLQGAETVLLALDSAVAAAGPCAFDAADVAGWQARAGELAQAIRTHFLVAGPPAHFEGGRPAWLIWPVQLLAPDDPLALSHATWLEQVSITPLLARTALGGGYDAENLLARAELQRARGDMAGLAETQQQVRTFIRELATPGTLHLSEFYARVPLDLDGDGIAPDYLPENDVPHVWEHAYLYLAAMVAFGSR
jgi:GH15 family glucan-1,4-alpha-glucosidase